MVFRIRVLLRRLLIHLLIFSFVFAGPIKATERPDHSLIEITEGDLEKAESLLRNLYLRWAEQVEAKGGSLNIQIEDEIQYFRDSLPENRIQPSIDFLETFLQLTRIDEIPIETRKNVETGRPFRCLALKDSTAPGIHALVAQIQNKWTDFENIRKSGKKEETTINPIPLVFGSLVFYFGIVHFLLSDRLLGTDSDRPYFNFHLRQNHFYHEHEEILPSLVVFSPVFLPAVFAFTYGIPWAMRQLRRIYGSLDTTAPSSEEKLSEVLKNLALKYRIRHLKQITEALIDPRLLAQPAWNEEDPCVICWEDYEAGAEAYNTAHTTRCGHKFHWDCLSLNPSNLCPTCRSDLY